MVVEVAVTAVALLVALGEVWHHQRVLALGGLAYGPGRRAAAWVVATPVLRVIAAAALAWGLATLALLPPRVHRAGAVREADHRDLLLVLDVSPSMRLEDAGPAATQSRRRRAAAVLTSLFERLPMEVTRTTVVAVYNGAKPVVLRTTDAEVVRNILEDLPMEYAFPAGPTDLVAGVAEAARLAAGWPPRRTALVIVSDGDTLPARGMPRLPDSIGHVVVIGVGDPSTGRFIDGHLSRQDASSLRQLAARLGGTYHDGNARHLPSPLVSEMSLAAPASALERLSAREYALLAAACGALVLAVLPVLLHGRGTRWVR